MYARTNKTTKFFANCFVHAIHIIWLTLRRENVMELDRNEMQYLIEN